MKNKFYAIMEGNKESSKLFVAEGRTRIEALNEVEENARKTGLKISYFGKFG